MTTRQYFGTDGIRKKVGEFPMTPDFVLKLGYAFGQTLVEKGLNNPTVIIGKDTRESCYMLEHALTAGLTAAGVAVQLTGPIPTPAVAYLTRALRLSAGIMISASHNPYYDNGIKFFAQGGIKLDDATESAIEQKINNIKHIQIAPQIGRAKRIDGSLERYIEFCKSTFPNHLSLKGLKIVIDTANGATYKIAPAVFHELGAQVEVIANQPNGTNINDHCGATHLAQLQKAVVAQQADLGIALDGDGDRLIMVDKFGKSYNGDQLVYIIAQARTQQGEKLTGIVGTQMSNLNYQHATEQQLGLKFVRAQVGDRYVLEQLHQHNWLLGGEGSGHILCLDKHNTGDGIIASLQVLASLIKLNKTLDSVLDWQLLPQTLINVRFQPDQDWQTLIHPIKQQIEQELGTNGRVLIRQSGTEPLIRIMVEAKEAEQAQHHAQRMAQALIAS